MAAKKSSLQKHIASKPIEAISRKSASQQNTAEQSVELDLAKLDAIYASAGLTRHRRGGKANVLKRARQQVLTPEELKRPLNAVHHQSAKGPHWLSVPGWEKYEWLWHGFTTRQGGLSTAYAPEGEPGELNLGFTADDSRKNVEENRRRISKALTGSSKTPLVTIRQFHSGLVLVGPSCVSSCEADRPHKADGTITTEQGNLLAILTADCIPVIVADKRQRVVAAFHAGWRGTVKRIVELGVGRMRLEFGSEPKDLIAAIGPGVGACCYAVGEEVCSEFESQFAYSAELFHEVYNSDPIRMRYPMLFLTQRAPGHSDIGPSTHLDLVETNRRQLLAAGIKPKAIHVIGGCTSCDRELFFSHRSSQGRAGRMMSLIGVRP
jgi:YfiH family protein